MECPGFWQTAGMYHHGTISIVQYYLRCTRTIKTTFDMPIIIQRLIPVDQVGDPETLKKTVAGYGFAVVPGFLQNLLSNLIPVSFIHQDRTWIGMKRM
jgi:hypothetical protein